MRKHIILDIIFTWSFCSIALAVGIWDESIELIIFDTILFVYVFIRTFRWLMFIYDKVFSKIITVETKGYRFSSKERVYTLDLMKKLHYSVIVFDDSKLKGKFILLDNNTVFKHGELLEITYYKNSKVIKSITKVS